MKKRTLTKNKPMQPTTTQNSFSLKLLIAAVLIAGIIILFVLWTGPTTAFYYRANQMTNTADENNVLVIYYDCAIVNDTPQLFIFLPEKQTWFQPEKIKCTGFSLNSRFCRFSTKEIQDGNYEARLGINNVMFGQTFQVRIRDVSGEQKAN
jgi:hypothetical protein